MPKFVYQKGTSAARVSQDKSTRIWRYQDLPKLLWTLATGSLWFARADTVGDIYEGSLTRAMHRARAAALRTMPGMGTPGGFNFDEVQTWMSSVSRAMVQNTALNCWHMGEHESAAMWKLYAAAGQGVAIRSSIDRLIRSFPEGTASHPTDGSRSPTPLADTSNRDSRGVPNVIAVDFGPVTYDDYLDTNTVVDGPWTGPRAEYFRKRKSFEHEREFRAIIFALAVTKEGHVDLNVPVFPDAGVAVPVDLEMLVEAIHVSPGAPRWFMEVVQEALRRFGRTFSVVQSNLDVDPIF